MRQAACLFVLLAVATAGGSGQSQAPVVKTITTGVVIDASVLDRDGHPVLDLRPEEFELTENGVRQQIVSATLVRGGGLRANGNRPVRPVLPASRRCTCHPRPSRPSNLSLGV